MYENQFIQFTQAIDPLDACIPLPVVFGGDGIAFFVPTDNKDAEFSVVDAEGNPFTYNGNTLHSKFRSLAGNYAAGMFYDGIALFRSKLFPANTARNYVAPDECFRIKIHSNETLANVSAFTYAVDASSIAYGESVTRTISIEGLTDKTFAKGTYTLKIPALYIRSWGANGVPYQQYANIQINAGSQMIFNQSADWYSNLLRRYENPKGELALLSYTCDTETFDLPFTSSRPIRQWLPIWLNKPAFNQKDEIYEKLSGERVVLFATINKELQAQTDYIPEWWHERIVLALSCDKVFVNGTRLTKSDNYDIDWDNHTEADCGVWLAKAKWKMVANVTSRNSNN